MWESIHPNFVSLIFRRFKWLPIVFNGTPDRTADCLRFTSRLVPTRSGVSSWCWIQNAKEISGWACCHSNLWLSYDRSSYSVIHIHESMNPNSPVLEKGFPKKGHEAMSHAGLGPLGCSSLLQATANKDITQEVVICSGQREKSENLLVPSSAERTFPAEPLRIFTVP